MAVSVTIHHSAFADARIRYLGELAGYSHMEALGRCAMLWSRCTELQTGGVIPVAEVRACLGPRGEEHLVEAGLGERIESGVVRVKGCSGRIEWFSTEGQQTGGRSRAATAMRDSLGRMLPKPSCPADHQLSPASDPDPDPDPESTDLVSGSSPSGASSSGLPGDHVRTPAPGSLALPFASVPAQPPDLRVTPGPTTDRANLRLRLYNEAWTLAGLEYEKLKSEGIEPEARNCWAGLPDASSFESKGLFARIDELLIGDKPDVARARDVLRNRILVAAAEARHNLRHLRFMVPARMWDPKNFAIGAALTPGQVEAEAMRRAGPKGAPESARRIKTL